MNSLTTNLFVSLLLIPLFAHGQIKIENVRPGERDYPEKNPKIEQTVNFQGTIDSRLKNQITFKLIYIAKNGDTDNTCRFNVSRLEGASGVFRLTEDVKLDFKKEEFQVQLPIDKFLPGRCGWAFSQLAYTFKSSSGVENTTPLITNNSSRAPMRQGESADGIFEINCDPNKRVLPCNGGFSQFKLRPQTKKLEAHFKVR